MIDLATHFVLFAVSLLVVRCFIASIVSAFSLHRFANAFAPHATNAIPKKQNTNSSIETQRNRMEWRFAANARQFNDIKWLIPFEFHY